MSKEKQIEEMAKVIESSLEDLGSVKFKFTERQLAEMLAEDLYGANCRKQNDEGLGLGMKALVTFMASFMIVGYQAVNYAATYLVADDSLMIGPIKLAAPEDVFVRLLALFGMNLIIISGVWIVDWLIQKRKNKKGGEE